MSIFHFPPLIQPGTQPISSSIIIYHPSLQIFKENHHIPQFDFSTWNPLLILPQLHYSTLLIPTKLSVPTPNSKPFSYLCKRTYTIHPSSLSFTSSVTNLTYPIHTHASCSSSNLIASSHAPSVMPSIWVKLKIFCPPEWITTVPPLTIPTIYRFLSQSAPDIKMYFITYPPTLITSHVTILNSPINSFYPQLHFYFPCIPLFLLYFCLDYVILFILKNTCLCFYMIPLKNSLLLKAYIDRILKTAGLSWSYFFLF